MIVITLVFAGMAWYEWHYLKQRNRRTRTFWIVGCFLAAAFLYMSAVFCIKDFASPNKLIEFALSPVLKNIRY
ncbi:hypothetical protein ACFQI7_22505 [Paenibacillus allorhizosphaerae]|uniref:Uncharacterized protein n=1 Tax=Paenibacillus allorhizosphaerae TaxID=2849866 RepID=A0ABM8VT54_9BACL|nr:hypothetical protein [Paenibacillus allorhizosphaerae]CAG7657218.1 hypothetical protein PAECIP111802_06659 [Paenibacillus allorhizosphaerae]